MFSKKLFQESFPFFREKSSKSVNFLYLRSFIIALENKFFKVTLMNYIKKMCILRQVKQGFSGDGKTLSGLVKVEQYGKNLAVEVSVINFAPLVSGEYYCLLSDGKGKTETLSLRGKSLFNILSDLDISRGFCAVICYVKNEIVPIAYGINGNGAYDWKSILNATLPPVFPKESEETAVSQPPQSDTYDDETVASENYFEEQNNEQDVLYEISDDARAESVAEKQDEKERDNAQTHVNAENLRHPFKAGGDGYYRSVKAEIDELFSKYEKDDTLKGAFACSEWVRVESENGEKKYLVGVLYEENEARYICYGLPAENRENPPEEIRDVCAFVPISPLDENKGYFVIFQSATTGECIKPNKV